MDIKDRLVEARTKMGLSQAELSEKCKLSQQTISKIESGRQTELRSASAERLANALGVTPEWLLYGTPEPQENPEAMLSKKYVIVNSLTVKACCGDGRFIDFEEVKGGFAFKRQWLDRKGLDPDSLDVICAMGDSMQPTIGDGNILLIDKSQTALSATKPMVCVVSYANEISVKRVFYSPEKSEVILSSDNPDKINYPNKIITFTEDNQLSSTFRVIGRVVWHGGEI